jgi:hypothetical protein
LWTATPELMKIPAGALDSALEATLTRA